MMQEWKSELKAVGKNLGKNLGRASLFKPEWKCPHRQGKRVDLLTTQTALLTAASFRT